MLPSETLMLLIVTIVLTLALLLAAAGRQGFKVDQEEFVYIPISTQPEKKILRYNPTTGKMEYAYPSEVLRYNWSTGKMEYASPDEELKYNPTTGLWEY